MRRIFQCIQCCFNSFGLDTDEWYRCPSCGQWYHIEEGGVLVPVDKAPLAASVECVTPNKEVP